MFVVTHKRECRMWRGLAGFVGGGGERGKREGDGNHWQSVFFFFGLL